MFFMNLKTRSKLFLSFFAVILLFSAALITGVLQINRISKKSNEVYQQNVRTLDTLAKLKSEYAELRRMTTVVALRGLQNDHALLDTAIDNAEKKYTEFKAAGESHLNRLTEVVAPQQSFDMVNSMLSTVNNVYWPVIMNIYDSASEGNIEEMMASVAKATELAGSIETEMSKCFTDDMDQASNNTEEITKLAESSMVVLIALAIIAATVSLILAYCFGSSISNRVSKLRTASMEVANGNLDFTLNDKNKDELGDLSRDLAVVAASINNVTSALANMANEFKNGTISSKIDSSGFNGVYKEIADEINEMFATVIGDSLSFFNCITEFGNGNFDAEANHMVGEKVVLTESLNNIRNKLKSVIQDISSLAGAAADGKLSDRVEVEKYNGDWAKMMSVLNVLMEAVSTPIAEAEQVLAEVAKGNFDKKITGDFHGDFLLIKKSVNNMIDNIDSYIGEISKTLTSLADNDLNLEVKREYVGEFSNIKDALNNIIRKFNSVISDISVSSSQVATGAKQISESSIALSEGTTEQAASVEELNATVQTINENTAKNAENAKEAESLSERSKVNAAKGDAHMKEMLASMNSIKESSNSISKIIKVIDDIAFQTNILALNAAVEGARAGVHGKGFSVVAEEVRNLAGRSQQAAKETSQLIEESINRVNEGTQMADSTAEALQTIVGDVSKVASIITHIATSSEEQATAISQITEGLSLITEVVQNNSATSEEAASAAEELYSQSELLKHLVSIFKLKK